jgi:hypothetical protein
MTFAVHMERMKLTHMLPPPHLSWSLTLVTYPVARMGTGGYLETRVKLPGDDFYSGFWPAFWAMGNLGRAGYMHSTEGERRCRGNLPAYVRMFGCTIPPAWLAP